MSDVLINIPQVKLAVGVVRDSIFRAAMYELVALSEDDQKAIANAIADRAIKDLKS